MSWLDFHEPGFRPNFAPNFTDSDLEDLAMALCGRDRECLYDVAATGRLDKGLATLAGSEELANFAALMVPGKCTL